MNIYQIATWVLAALLIVSLVLNIKSCTTTSATVIADSTTIQGPTTTITKDSITIRQQQVVILQTQTQVQALEDSVERMSFALTGVQPSYIVRYSDTLKLHDTVNYLAGAVTVPDSTLVDSLLKASNAKDLIIQNMIAVPVAFSDSGKFFAIKGVVNKNFVNISNLSVPNTTSVIIGQKNSLFSTGPVTVNIAESNPLLTPGPVQTYYYQPKVRKWSIVVGPSILFNGKAFSEGVAITGGYKLF